jgi:hypothetical protein
MAGPRCTPGVVGKLKGSLAAVLAQLVERRIVVPEVVGSNPTSRPTLAVPRTPIARGQPSRHRCTIKQETSMDSGHEPATKADLEELRADVKHDIDEFRADLKENVAMLRSEFQHGFDDLKETLRDTQTELLKAFYSFTTTNQQRLNFPSQQ